MTMNNEKLRDSAILMMALGEDAAADQRFHVLDVLPADFIGDRADADCARRDVRTHR